MTDGFQVADLVGNYLGEHKNSMNNRTQARLGLSNKNLTQHLLGTKEHYAVEKIQSFMRKPVMMAGDVKYPYIPSIHIATKITKDIMGRNRKLVEQGTGKVLLDKASASMIS
eukprot:SAG31_NODE_12881_length_909_cov_1.438272_1_plen_112_part_00